MKTDVIIIGAGVIGLSIGYYLSKQKYNVVILEKKNKVGLVNSSRNTEVIHSGAYYQENTLKSKLSIRGKNLLYEFCEKHKIKYKKIGKIFLALDQSETSNLEKIYNQSIINGLNDLQFLNQKDLFLKESNLKSFAGLLSPSTGILNSYELITTLENLNTDNGVIISLNTSFNHAKYLKDSWEIFFTDLNSEEKINAKFIINSAGLNSVDIAKQIFPKMDLPKLNPIKGSYLRYSGKSPFNHIIYPSLTPGLLKERVDATPDISGSLRFGPTIEETLNLEDFDVPNNLIDRLYNQIKSYFPSIDKSKLTLDLSGIRPKISILNDSNPDFIIKEYEKQWFNLLGIESPGLTCCLSIGEYVELMLSNY